MYISAVFICQLYFVASCNGQSLAAQIQTALTSLPNLVAFWPLTKDFDARDATSNRIDGVPSVSIITTSPVAYGPTYKVNTALQLTSLPQQTYYSFSSPLLNVGGSSFAISIWVYLTTTDMPIFQFHANYTYFHFWQYAGPNVIVVGGYSLPESSFSASCPNMTSGWQFVGIVWNSGSKSISVFCKDNFVVTNTDPANNPLTANDLYLGHRLVGGYNADGLVACASIFKTAFTVSQMLQVKGLCPMYHAITCNSNCMAGTCRVDLTVASGYTCTCVSNTYYTGPSCDTPVCAPACGNGGTCTAPNTCACAGTWSGPLCSENCSVLCVHGACRSAPNQCQCSPGYTGPACDIPFCMCKNGGSCTAPYSCQCPANWIGVDCSMATNTTMKMALEYRLGGANVMTSTSKANLRDCAVACQQTINCKSVNYHTASLTCNLLDKDLSSGTTTVVCDTDYTHLAIDATRMPGYYPSRNMSIDFFSAVSCPKPYDYRISACPYFQRWEASSCASKVFLSCMDAYNKGETRSGVYLINPDGGTAFEIYCNMESDATISSTPGSMTVLRRRDGSVNFNVNWATFKQPIGNANAEFWVGAENLHRLTNPTPSELTYIIWPFEGDGLKVYGRWTSFSIATASANYTMSASNYSSPMMINTDLLRFMNGNNLHTLDTDVNSCVANNKGPEWTSGNPCHLGNPFGAYLYGYQTLSSTGICVADYLGINYSHRQIEWRLK